MHPLSGVHVPVVTPFDESGRVDLGALDRLARRLLDDGADGLVALGTTGEPATLDAVEREAVVDCCAEVCRERGRLLIVGAGGNDTRAAAEEVARRAAQAGVGALLSVVPPYTRPSTEGVVAHFERLAPAAGALPLIVYEHPGRSAIRLGTAGLLRLHAAAPNVAGVKLALTALDSDALALLLEAPPSFAVLAGDDALAYPLLALGGAGAISAAAHCATDRWVALLAAVRRGDVGAARSLARELAPLTAALFAEPSPAVIKAVLAARGEIASDAVRLPLLAATPAAAGRAAAAG